MTEVVTRQAALDRFFRRGAWLYDLQLPLERPALRVAAVWAGALDGLRVLDVAAGTGGLARALLTVGGRPRELALLDRSPEMLRRAARRLAWASPRIVTGDARRLPWPEDRFDLVGVSFLLHLLAPPTARAVLEEARRVLAPGGRLLVVHHVTAAGPRGAHERRIWRALPALAPGLLPAGPSGSLATPLRDVGLDLFREREVAGVYRSQVILAASSPGDDDRG